MAYKRKIVILSGLVAVLGLIYILAIVFDPDRSGRRSDNYVWLESRLRDAVDRIDIFSPASPITLLFRSGQWLVSWDGAEYPARQSRIEDLLDELSRRAAYPRRSGSASAHERFGLTEANALRITLRGGAGLPLLDLLLGNNDAGGRNIYLRRANNNEVRSGEDRLSSYVESPVTSWYNLRLFPDDAAITTDLVQRLTVNPPAGENIAPALVFTREQNSWRITGGGITLGPGDLDKNRVDSYISGVLSTSGEDFVSPSGFLNDASLMLELGDGRVLTLRLGPADEEGRRPAGINGAAYEYSLSSWATERFFRDMAYFGN
jgi:hypothetical protein